MLKIIQNVELAQSTILKRVPAGAAELPARVRERIRATFGREMTAEEVVAQIVRDVRAEGDTALFDYSRRLDGATVDRLEVPAEEIASAKKKVDERLLESLSIAAERIETFHRNQRALLPKGQITMGDGVGQVVAPLERVGIYAPGGTASYPSTVLMTVIPARAAGVDEVILATPPRPDGHIPPLTLTAAAIAGADRVFALGGAPAIAALAFGSKSVPRVDKICGPGNIFVMLAKKHVFGVVDIDGLQGPTETIVLADASANPRSCAADLLAQAEHDEMASAILITPSFEMAQKVSVEVDRQLARLDRRTIAEKSLEERGGIVVVAGMDEAVSLINTYAPEHLCILTKDPQGVAARIRHAGGIFLGESSPEVLGDYVAGPSHVMPTGGTARFSSPLNVLDFLKVTSIVALDDGAFGKLSPHAVAIARAEGLTGHSRAAEERNPGANL
ncbi:MAG: histidinol dehydrogenase [Chloroflexi bacterium]|nr:histidinol dehydrogenase [Chloroflexota bacterium]